MLIVAALSAAFAGSDIAICYSSGYEYDTLAKLKGTKLFTSIVEYNCGALTPGVVDFLNHDAVLVYSDSGFSNGVALGDNLAGYADSGGGVVEAVFANGSVPLSGRFESGGYEPITGSTQSSGVVLTSVVDDASHLVWAGVAGLNGGSSSYHTADAGLSPTAYQVAHWSNGKPLVAVDDTRPGRTVGLNFYPPSSGARGDFWAAATDGEWIMANALDWAIGAPSGAPTAPTLSVSGVCPGPVTIEIFGGTPDGTATIYSDVGAGAGSVPHGVCAGSAMDLTTPTGRKTVNLDASGYAIMTPTMGAGPCGMALQVVDRESCNASTLGFIP